MTWPVPLRNEGPCEVWVLGLEVSRNEEGQRRGWQLPKHPTVMQETSQYAEFGQIRLSVVTVGPLCPVQRATRRLLQAGTLQRLKVLSLVGDPVSCLDDQYSSSFHAVPSLFSELVVLCWSHHHRTHADSRCRFGLRFRSLLSYQNRSSNRMCQRQFILIATDHPVASLLSLCVSDRSCFRETTTASPPWVLANTFGHDVICSEFSCSVLIPCQWSFLSISPSSQPAGLGEEFRKSLACPATLNLRSFSIFLYTVSHPWLRNRGVLGFPLRGARWCRCGSSVETAGGCAGFTSTVLSSWHPGGLTRGKRDACSKSIHRLSNTVKHGREMTTVVKLSSEGYSMRQGCASS